MSTDYPDLTSELCEGSEGFEVEGKVDGGILGETSWELLEREDLEVARTGSYTGAEAIQGQIAELLLKGIAVEDISDAGDHSIVVFLHRMHQELDPLLIAVLERANPEGVESGRPRPSIDRRLDLANSEIGEGDPLAPTKH